MKRFADGEQSVTFAAIEAAAELLEGRVLHTPTVAAQRLSALSGAQIFVKYENMQATGSFKDRGAFAKLTSLDPDQKKNGVIAISAGNHAQAVAYHASRLGIAATIVMPAGTPFNKISNTEAFGAKVVLCGESLADCAASAEDIRLRDGLTLVHPYDDPIVISGQGTVGIELIRDCPTLDCLVIPIGGGGLISGIAIAAKALNPAIEIVGVEVASYAASSQAINGGSIAFGGPTLAEGIAVKSTGEHTLPIIRALVSDIILVSETAVEDAVFTYASVQKTVAEGASAAALAAVLANRSRFEGRSVGLVQCGANIDPRILAAVMVRGLEREGKIVSLRVTIYDRPGMLGEIASVLGRCGANILEVHHRRLYLDVPAKGAIVELLIETKDEGHASSTVDRLREAGFDVRRSGLHQIS